MSSWAADDVDDVARSIDSSLVLNVTELNAVAVSQMKEIENSQLNLRRTVTTRARWS